MYRMLFPLRSVMMPLIVLITILAAHESVVAGSPPTNLVLQPGEELVYKVKYGFIRLGTVTVSTLRDDSSSTPARYRLVMKLESSAGVPFFTLHEYDVSIIDATTMMSKQFYSTRTGSGKNIETQFHYEEKLRRAYFMRKDLTSGTILQNLTMEDTPPYLEGPTLLFYGRWQSRSHQVQKIPTMVDGKILETTLDFTKGRQYIDIDAAEHVRIRKYEGFTGESVAPAGVSGTFTIWVSDDDAAVPIRVQMNIAVGAITMELEKWTRANWQPPS